MFRGAQGSKLPKMIENGKAAGPSRISPHISRRNLIIALVWIAVIAILFFSSIYDYLLFHSFAEIFSIVIAFAIFTLAWNSRRYINNHYFLVIGISYLFIGIIDLVHTFAYKGMGIFPESGSNLATQLWIAARYLQSLSLLIAPFFIRRKLNIGAALGAYSLVTILLLVSIVHWDIFPVAYIEGTGLTTFKVISEYVISLILLVGIWMLYRNRNQFDNRVFGFIVASMVVTIASEMAFTLYTDVYGIMNITGHVLKIVAFFFIYRALVVTGIRNPYDLLFRELKHSEQQYRSLFSMMTEAFGLHEILLDEKGEPCDYRFIEVNKSFESLTGLSGVEGKTAKEVIPGIEPYLIKMYGQVALSGEPVTFQNYSQPLNRWYDVYAYSPEKGRFVTLFRDITQQKRAESEILALSKFPSENPNPVLRAAGDGTIIYANEGSGTLLEWWGTREGRLLPAEYQNVVNEALDSGSGRRIEIDCNGRVFYLFFTPIVEEGYVNIYGNDITGRKRAENAVREEKDRLFALINSMADEVWFADAEGKFTLMNEAALREFGIAGSAGVNVEELAGNLEVYSTDGSPRPVDKAPPLRALKGEIVINEEEIIRLPRSGELEYRQVSSSPVKGADGRIIGSISVVRNITEQKKIEDILLETERDLSRAQEVAKIGSWRLDIKQSTLTWSDEVYRIFGVPVGTAITFQAFLDMVHPEDREYVETEWNRALQDYTYEIEHRIVAGETIKWVREKAEMEFDEQGTLISGFGTVQDITEQKKAEQMKDEFIGLVSHELRTPLTIIIGSIRSAMSPGISTEDTYELLQNAAEGADLLSDILENMLEMSRHQAGRLNLEKQRVSIQSLAARVIGRLKGQNAAQEFVTDFSPDIPPVEADPVRVERILVNLLGNAVKYSPANSVITLSCRAVDGFVVTEVADHGDGISPEEQAQLFEPFQRLERTARTHSGIGLGLVVCKRLAEVHNGWIKVESVPGQGSIFSFGLPLTD
jgi:PAS domain S-box-containing protein